MDPLTMAGLSFGASAFSSIIGHNQKKEQTRQANKQIKANNRFQMQNWQYGEQMRQRQNKQAKQIYEMNKQNYQLQKELDYDAYKEFYEDSQLQFENLVRDVKQKSFESANKLAAYQDQAMASALSRGATGRRAGVRGANAALKQGMGQASRAEKLVFAEEQMGTRIDRAAKRTDLRIKQAFNNVGPAPEDLPMAPLPVMGQMQKGPSQMGLFADLAGGAINAMGTYSSLKAPKTGR